MQSNLSTGYAGTALTGRSISAGQAESMALFDILKSDRGAIYQDDGIRIHVWPVLDIYRIAMVHRGQIYQRAARWLHTYNFLYEMGIPLYSGWRVSHAR